MAAGLLTLAACQKETVAPSGPGYSSEAIVFTSPYTVSRSAQMRDGNFNNEDRVGVIGYCQATNQGTDISTSPWETKKVFAEPDMFYNKQLTYDGQGLWSYSGYRNESTGLCPWYDNEAYTYTFFAYYPYAENGRLYNDNRESMGTIALSGANVAGDPTITYTMPHTSNRFNPNNTTLEWDRVPDFMVADKVDHLKSDGPVSLRFSHALCAFEVEVNNYNENAVTLNNVTFSGTDFYKEISLTGTVEQSAYPYAVDKENTYSGRFSLANNFECPAGQTTRLTTSDGEAVTLLLITDENGRVTAADGGQCQLNVTAKTIAAGKNFTMYITEGAFQPGLRNICTINIVGNDIVLQMRSTSNWDDGGDSEIVFE